MTIKTKKRIIALSIAGAVVAGWLGVTNHFDKMEAAEQAQRAAATEARQKAKTQRLRQKRRKHVWIECPKTN